MVNEFQFKSIHYNQVRQELLGGSLDGGGQHGDSLDGLFTLKTALEDPVADDHQGWIGAAGDDQSIQQHHLAK